MTPTPIFDTDETKNDRINDYVIAMKSVANKLGVKLIDLNAIVRKDLKTRNIKWEDIALDNIHYVDSYYTRLAEFIFSFGLAPSDIIVKDETFLNAEHPAFVFPQSRAYFTSNANPEKSNIWLYGDDSTKQQAWLYVFVDEKAVDLIVYNIFNPSTSNANKVNIDGVDYPVPSYLNNGNTFWNVKQNILKLAYGLHKIKFWAVSQDTTHKHFLLNGVEFKKNANEPKTTGGLLTGTKKILDGSLNFKSTGASTITFNELLTLEKKKYNITFQAISGYGFGLGSFEARNGTDIRKFPFLILCQTGDKFNAFVLTVSNNSTADFNTYSYYQLVIGSVAATAGDNLLELNITDTLINAKINGTQCLALDNTIFPQKFVPDLWLYASKNDSALSVTKIEEVLG